MPRNSNRRQWLATASAAVIGLAAGAPELRAAEREKDEEEMEVPAVEDLMREHGVLRRALLVYSEAASRLSHGKSDLPLEALGRTAVLFRSFGEEYHELSEQFEELEHKMFGKDGFEDAVKRIASIEQAFGLSDLNALTAPVPPGAG